MSWEGYEQVLCALGHLFEVDQWELIEEAKCPVKGCGSPAVWSNTVNETNGCYNKDESKGEEIASDHSDCICGFIPLERFEVVEAEKTHTCSCGHVHVVSEARYKIPLNVGRIQVDPELKENADEVARETDS